MTYSYDSVLHALNHDTDLGHVKREPDFDHMSTDHHNAAGQVQRYRERLTAKGSFDSTTISGFIDMLGVVGLSPGRQMFYASRLPKLLEAVRATGAKKVAGLDVAGCRQVLARFTSGEQYGGETKIAYALCLKKLVQYARTGNLDGKQVPYVDEISWIRVGQYRSKAETVSRKDLLSGEEFVRMVQATGNIRDRALLWVMYEGAFRPGEILNMRVGGIEFADRYMMVSTEGKTGPKSVALMLSLTPMIQWLSIHPYSKNPKAPLWYSSMSPEHRVTYGALGKIVRQSARNAGLQKKVWGYLLRHTQLTNMSTKLPDSLLRLYGNWTPSSKMSSRYTHLSDEDTKNAVLKMHGIDCENSAAIDHLRMLKCPRCETDCTPDLTMCPECGLLLQEEERAKVTTNDIVRSRMRDKLLRANALEQEVDGHFEEIMGSNPKKRRLDL